MTREQALDALDLLARVEHSLCVEYLSVHCALGHDLDPAGAGATAEHVAAAAHAAAVSAQNEMRHLHDVNRALVHAGRSAQLARASSIRGSGGSDIALGPLTVAQLERLVERERELASAVDELYARLRPAVAPPNPVFEDELLEEMTRALDPPPDHSQLPATLQKELKDIPASKYLRATPHAVAEGLEGALLELSDHFYRVLVGILETWFAHEDELFGARSLAIDTMTGLDRINRLLVERGVLPAFTPVAA